MKTTNLRGLIAVLFFSFVNCMLVQAQYQLTPECYVEIEPNRYVIHFTLPDYFMEEEESECGIYSTIVMGDEVDHDETDEAGYPTLPFFSLDLLLPQCVSSVSINLEQEQLEQVGVGDLILPARLGSVQTEDGNTILLDEECHNLEYYTYGSTGEYPNGFFRDFYATSNIYNYLSNKGVTLSIHPFSYYPEYGYMDVLREAIFVIEWDCGDLISTMDSLQQSGTYNSYVGQLYFDTFNEIEIENTGVNGKYLIVAARRDMEGDIETYVSYKRSQNYETEVIYLDESGVIGNAEQISNVIYNNDFMDNPDFVLLVGDLYDIPARYGSNSIYNPYSDDKYHPFLGRWIIGEQGDMFGSYYDLTAIINKTIAAENNYVNTYSTAALFSGVDHSSQSLSRRLYKNIEKIANKSFDRMGIPYTLYDGRNYSSNPNQAQNYMCSTLQSNTRFFVYMGHGNRSMVGEPYILHYSNLPNSTYPFSMGFGFACSMNSYTTDSNFGARWLADGHGGAAFYASTVNAGVSSTKSLSKKIFTQLRKLTNKIGNFPISMWLRIAEDKYYNACRGLERGLQISKFNLMGDPTLAVYGMDEGGGYAPFHISKKDNRDIEENNFFTENQIDKIEIYNIDGDKVATIDNEATILQSLLQPGVYFVKTIYKDGTMSTYKFMK